MFGTLCVAKSEFSTHRSRLFIVIVHSHRDVCHIIRLMLDFQSVISTSVVFHSEHDLEKKKNEQKTEKKEKNNRREKNSNAERNLYGRQSKMKERKKKNDSRRCGIFRGQSRPDYNRNCKQSATRCLAEQYKYKTNTNT